MLACGPLGSRERRRRRRRRRGGRDSDDGEDENPSRRVVATCDALRDASAASVDGVARVSGVLLRRRRGPAARRRGGGGGLARRRGRRWQSALYATQEFHRLARALCREVVALGMSSRERAGCEVGGLA